MVLPRVPRANPPRMVPVGEASKILHVHPNTLRKWNDQGLIPSYRIGRRRDRRFAVEDLVAFLKRVGANGRHQRRRGSQQSNGRGTR